VSEASLKIIGLTTKGFEALVKAFNQITKPENPVMKFKAKIPDEKTANLVGMVRGEVGTPLGTIHTITLPIVHYFKNWYVLVLPLKFTNDRNNEGKEWFKARMEKAMKQLEPGMIMELELPYIQKKNKAVVSISPERAKRVKYDPEKAGIPNDDYIDFKQIIQRKPFPGQPEIKKGGKSEPGGIVEIDGEDGKYLVQIETTTTHPKPKKGKKPVKEPVKKIKTVPAKLKKETSEKPKPKKTEKKKPVKKQPEGIVKKSTKQEKIVESAKRIEIEEKKKPAKPVKKEESELLEGLKEAKSGKIDKPVKKLKKTKEKSTKQMLVQAEDLDMISQEFIPVKKENKRNRAK
jgi:hypothetical protein